VTTEVQRNALGSFAELGFTVDHEGDETIRLVHEGVTVHRFSQLGATAESLQAECARHLVLKHHWDGALWHRQIDT